MNETEWSIWLQTHDISSPATNLIQQIRSSPPSRKVRSSHSNVIGNYPSHKMGQTIQFESHKVELAFIREYEFDENVLEYYDQPEPIKISYRSANGKMVTVFTTPDFFVIRNDGTAGWEECKPEQELVRLAEKSERFTRNEEGLWKCPAGEAYAKPYNLYFRVRSSEEINWVWQRNIEYLSDYIQADDHHVSTEAESFLTALVSCKQGILVSELVEHAQIYTPDDLFHLIAQGKLYVDLYNNLLSEQDRTPVYTSEDHLSYFPIAFPLPELNSSDIVVGAKLVWDGKAFEAVNCGIDCIWLRNESDQTVQLQNQELEKLVKIGAVKVVSTDDKHEMISYLQNQSPAT